MQHEIFLIHQLSFVFGFFQPIQPLASSKCFKTNMRENRQQIVFRGCPRGLCSLKILLIQLASFVFSFIQPSASGLVKVWPLLCSFSIRFVQNHIRAAVLAGIWSKVVRVRFVKELILVYYVLTYGLHLTAMTILKGQIEKCEHWGFKILIWIKYMDYVAYKPDFIELIHTLSMPSVFFVINTFIGVANITENCQYQKTLWYKRLLLIH